MTIRILLHVRKSAAPSRFCGQTASWSQSQSAHQPRLRGEWHDPFPHCGAPQGSGTAEQKKAEPASRLERQKVRKQTSIEHIHGDGTADDVRPAHSAVLVRHFAGSDVSSLSMSRYDDLGYGRRIPQPQIQALRSDRRERVCRLTHEYDAGRATPRGRLNGQREYPAAGLDLDPAEDGMRTALDLFPHQAIGKFDEIAGFVWMHNEYEARAPSRQRDERERARLGVELGRNVMVLASVSQIECQGGLGVGPPRNGYARGGPAQ
jgi:hypothetical protein